MCWIWLSAMVLVVVAEMEEMLPSAALKTVAFDPDRNTPEDHMID